MLCTINKVRKRPSIHLLSFLYPYQSSPLHHPCIYTPSARAPLSQCKPPNARIRTVVPTQSIRNAKRVKLRRGYEEKWFAEQGIESHKGRFEIGERRKKLMAGRSKYSSYVPFLYCVFEFRCLLSRREERGGNAPMIRRESLGKGCIRFQYSVIVVFSLRSCMLCFRVGLLYKKRVWSRIPDPRRNAIDPDSRKVEMI